LDPDHVAAEGARQFGFAQSEIYEQELVAMLDTLAAMRYLAAERQASQQVVRLMPYGAIIFSTSSTTRTSWCCGFCTGYKTGSNCFESPFAEPIKAPIYRWLPGA